MPSKNMFTQFSSPQYLNKLKMFLFISFLFGIPILLFTQPRLMGPILLSYVFFLASKIFIPFFSRLGLKQVAIAFITVTIFLGLFFIPLFKLIPSLVNEAQNLQVYLPKVERQIKDYVQLATHFINQKTGRNLEMTWANDFLSSITVQSKKILLQLPKYLAVILEWLILVPIFLFFFVKDGQKFKRFALQLVPQSIFERTHVLYDVLNKKLGLYFLAKILEASILGGVVTLGFMSFDINFAVLFGVIAGISNIIPYVGPLLGMIPPVSYALVEYGFTPPLLFIVVLLLVANLVDMIIVFPILVSKSVDLHPLLVIISVILGSSLLGLTGMILSIPLAVALKLVILEIYGHDLLHQDNH